VIADRGYDSAPLRSRLKRRGTELIAPYRSNNRHRRFEDKRKLRRYRKRWKIERTNAWLQNFRRIQVRYDRILTVFQGFFHCACLLITLRHLCNFVVNVPAPITREWSREYAATISTSAPPGARSITSPFAACPFAW
jgi:transposase